MRRMRSIRSKSPFPPHNLARLKRVRELIDGLKPVADAFLSQNIGIELLERALRHAFARSAAARFKKKNGAVNVSKAAAVTGIPRAALTRLLNDHILIDDLAVHTPIERISLAW